MEWAYYLLAFAELIVGTGLFIVSVKLRVGRDLAESVQVYLLAATFWLSAYVLFNPNGPLDLLSYTMFVAMGATRVFLGIRKVRLKVANQGVADDLKSCQSDLSDSEARREGHERREGRERYERSHRRAVP